MKSSSSKSTPVTAASAPVFFFFVCWIQLLCPAAEAREYGQSCDNNENKCNQSRYLTSNRDGICDCATGSLYHGGRGKCEVQYGRDCSRNPNCNLDQYLTCISGKCSCQQHWKWNNVINPKCVGYLGASCQLELLGDTCGTNLECGVGGCICKEKHYGEILGEGCSETTNGSKCTDTRNCDYDHFLVCRSGMCGCETPKEMIWAPKDDECVALVGTTCDIERDEHDRQLDCVAGAKCQGSGPTGICKCEDDGEVNEWGGCTNYAKKNAAGVVVSILITFALLARATI
jgi:hypothetical protein